VPNKEKQDAAEAAGLATQAALAKNLADEQERLARFQKEAENQKRWAEKRAAEEVARRATEQARVAETRRLEAEFEARQEAARKETARQEAIRKVQEAARQMEIDAASLEASLPGLRVSELLALRWQDCDFEAGDPAQP
jgi:integrase